MIKVMRSVLWKMLVLLLCQTSYGCGEKSARVSGNLNVDTLWMTYQNWSDSLKSQKEPVMILANDDRCFAIDLPDNEAAYTVELDYRKTHARPLRILAVPGEQVIVTGWHKSNINGSGFYQRWNGLKKDLDSLRRGIVQYGFFKASTLAKNRDDWGKLGAVRDTTEMYRKELSDRIFAYIQSHPKDPVGVMTLDYLSGEEMERAFGMLDRSVQEGPLRFYAKARLDRYRAEKAKEESEEKLKEQNEVAQRECAERLYEASAKKVLEAGDAMPDLPFTDINGNEVYLSGFKGRYVYIDCWATWCAPCVAMIPKVKALEEAVSDKTDIVFVSISLDKKRDWWEKMVNDRKLDGIQWYAGGSSKVLQDFFQIQGIPRFILLDKEGRILSAKLDYAANENARQELESLLGIK